MTSGPWQNVSCNRDVLDHTAISDFVVWHVKMYFEPSIQGERYNIMYCMKEEGVILARLHKKKSVDRQFHFISKKDQGNR